MRNRTLLAKKMEIFYNDIKSNRSGKMRLKTDLEFSQNKIKERHKKFGQICFIQNFMVEKHLQRNKNQGVKKILLRSKRIEKLKKKELDQIS